MEGTQYILTIVTDLKRVKSTGYYDPESSCFVIGHWYLQNIPPRV